MGRRVAAAYRKRNAAKASAALAAVRNAAKASAALDGETTGVDLEVPGVVKTGLQLRLESFVRREDGVAELREIHGGGVAASRLVHERAVLVDCPDCGVDLSDKECFATDLDGKSTCYEVLKLKLIYDSLVSGRGFGGLSDMCFNVGLPTVHNGLYSRYSAFVYRQTGIMWERHVAQLAPTMKRVLGDFDVASDADGCLEVAVSYDGTWMTRGHRSHVGVGYVIDIVRGFVLDVKVISNL